MKTNKDFNYRLTNTNKMEYINPSYEATAFNCPICGAYAEQQWFQLAKVQKETIGDDKISMCNHCNDYVYWEAGKMIFPYTARTAPVSSPNLPDSILADYNEAEKIIDSSPRAAAAILRLSIQKLCVHLGETGENIDLDINNLVERGLPVNMREALESAKVIGRNMVKPGVIDSKDDNKTAMKLFTFVNIIAYAMIANPCEVDKLAV